MKFYPNVSVIRYADGFIQHAYPAAGCFAERKPRNTRKVIGQCHCQVIFFCNYKDQINYVKAMAAEYNKQLKARQKKRKSV